MLRQRKKLIATLVAVVALPIAVWLGLYLAGAVPPPGKPILPPFNLSDRISTLVVEETASGELVTVFGDGEHEGAKETLTGDQFLREVKSRNAKTPFLYKLFDITSWTGVLWVGFGFLGQAVFMGRMIVQWWASEKAKSSIVPPSFWWMSLIGATMLMIYFVWRKEIVGFIGQSTGWLIYVRNLWFIHGSGVRNGGETQSR